MRKSSINNSKIPNEVDAVDNDIAKVNMYASGYLIQLKGKEQKPESSQQIQVTNQSEKEINNIYSNQYIPQSLGNTIRLNDDKGNPSKLGNTVYLSDPNKQVASKNTLEEEPSNRTQNNKNSIAIISKKGDDSIWSSRSSKEDSTERDKQKGVSDVRLDTCP